MSVRRSLCVSSVAAQVDNMLRFRNPKRAVIGICLGLGLLGTGCGDGGIFSQLFRSESPHHYEWGTISKLEDTDVYADFSSKLINSKYRAYGPTFPLWSDGLTKQRYIFIPVGTAIDNTTNDGWVFPVGTKVVKEFSRW